MADPRGFLKLRERELPPNRPVEIRLLDYRDVHEQLAALPSESAFITRQASRCMDCGIPFCHQGCPLGNLIPEWNDYVRQGQWELASERLHATNNFPEFTGRICPAPCESSCVLGINQPAVTIKNIEVSIVDEAWARGYLKPQPPERLTGQTVAVIGSGPAGLAAAQQLTRAGHTTVVYERDDELGGLLRYGVPDFKLEKHHIDRRLEQMRAEGTKFRTGVHIGVDIGWDELHDSFDALVVATGATVAREMQLPGRELSGIYPAMDYLSRSNAHVAGKEVADFIDAKGLDVIVIGGGDTGSDCVGTALRQGARSVTTLAIGKQPPLERTSNQPWPTDPQLFEVSSSHEEGGERKFLASTVRFEGSGKVQRLIVSRTQYNPDGSRVPTPGTEEALPAQLVLIALGFTGPDTQSISPQLGLVTQPGKPIPRSEDFSSSIPGVFVAGDAGRGQSLIVWAIAEGRAAAARIDEKLRHRQTNLPEPVSASTRPLQPKA